MSYNLKKILIGLLGTPAHMLPPPLHHGTYNTTAVMWMWIRFHIAKPHGFCLSPFPYSVAVASGFVYEGKWPAASRTPPPRRRQQRERRGRTRAERRSGGVPCFVVVLRAFPAAHSYSILHMPIWIVLQKDSHSIFLCTPTDHSYYINYPIFYYYLSTAIYFILTLLFSLLLISQLFSSLAESPSPPPPTAAAMASDLLAPEHQVAGHCASTDKLAGGQGAAANDRRRAEEPRRRQAAASGRRCQASGGDGGTGG